MVILAVGGFVLVDVGVTMFSPTFATGDTGLLPLLLNELDLCCFTCLEYVFLREELEVVGDALFDGLR